MFSTNLPSSSTPPSHSWSSFPASTGLRSKSLLTSATLPTGDCRFILLHPSIPDQRCSCQGFRRNESRPGANCECGHQACYHAPGPINGPTEEPVPPSTPHATTLLDRICRLEEQYHHDRKIWQDELKEERRARREDAMILREAMSSFYRFMEQEVPQKFDHVEDKIEGFLDQLLRLEERVGVIDDSTMALENRVADLEGDGDDENVKDDEQEGHQEPKEQEYKEQESKEQEHRGKGPKGEEYGEEERIKDEQHTEEEQRERKRLRTEREAMGTSTHDDRTATERNDVFDNNAARDGDHSTSMTKAPSLTCVKSERRSPCRSPCHTPYLTITPVSTKSLCGSDLSPAADFACSLNNVNAPAPITGSHTFIHALLSPTRDFISQLVPKIDLPSSNSAYHLQSQLHDRHSSIRARPADIDSLVTGSPQSPPGQRSPSPRPALVRASQLLSSSDLTKKRKRDMNNYQLQGADNVHVPQLMLPTPPPLSLGRT